MPECWCGNSAEVYLTLEGETEYACLENGHADAAEQVLKARVEGNG